jgi:signal transduction histidine kinase
VLTAVPVVAATEGGTGETVWAAVLGGLSGSLVAISARLVSVRGRPWAEALGSLLFPCAMATLAVAGLAAPFQLLERADLGRTLGQVASLAGFALLSGAALRRIFARSRPPRFAAPPLNGLATFSASTLAVLAIVVAALVSRWHGHAAASDLLGIFALVALGAYVGRAFILRSAVHRLVHRLESTTERLRELDRLKDEFLALVSHELRTPLTSIKGYLSVMGDGDVADDRERARYLEIVDRNARRLEQLVEDLLLIAQIDAGKLELDRLEVDLAVIVADAVDSAGALARARGIEITLERSGPSPLLGDATRLAQVVDNLLANALKFTPDGGSIRVRVGSESAEAYVEIEDTGIGIPSEEQAQLFQRFFRATNARQRAIKGTGLGLAICRAIVEAHRGFITLHSEPHAGTTVAVRFPVVAHADTRRAQAA